MGKLRYGLALFFGKLSVPVLKITRHNGTNFPGIVALKICPDFLKYVKKPKYIIGVTGTNGKTTISNMLSDTLRSLGINPLNNGAGSNINSGIATCFLSGVTLFGREKYDMAVLEMDERSSRLLFPYIHPDQLIITNLSRDSIMRNAHPGYIRDILTRYMPKKSKLILNADDIIASDVAPENDRVYFGIEKMDSDGTECRNLIEDCQICPECHTKLRYEYIRYSNIGRVYCPGCGFSSPEYDYSASKVDPDSGKLVFNDRVKNDEMEFDILNDGIFNIYNQVAVIAVMRELGYSLSEIKEAMSQTSITSSRFGSRKVGDVEVVNLLCKEKNAYAASRVFEYLDTVPGDKEILLYNNCIGDTKHWSENTCWMYDCDFEFLNNDSVKQVVVYGDRAKDYRLRLLLAGVPDERITCVRTPDEGIDRLNFTSGEKVYVLYGTDSYALGMGTTAKVRKRLEERQNA